MDKARLLKPRLVGRFRFTSHMESVKKEIAIMKKLDHPNVVGIAYRDFLALVDTPTAGFEPQVYLVAQGGDGCGVCLANGAHMCMCVCLWFPLHFCSLRRSSSTR